MAVWLGMSVMIFKDSFADLTGCGYHKAVTGANSLN